MALAADNGEDFIAMGDHILFRFRFEIETDERFGIGAADIEPPIGEFDAQAVELEHFAFRSVGFLE